MRRPTWLETKQRIDADHARTELSHLAKRALYAWDDEVHEWRARNLRESTVDYRMDRFGDVFGRVNALRIERYEKMTGVAWGH